MDISSMAKESNIHWGEGKYQQVIPGILASHISPKKKKYRQN